MSRSRSRTTAARGPAARARSLIDGKPHGPHHGVASCQTYMRSYKEGDVIVAEFRARPFPVVKDLIAIRLFKASDITTLSLGGFPLMEPWWGIFRTCGGRRFAPAEHTLLMQHPGYHPPKEHAHRTPRTG